jgi:hypothetical protein
MRSPCGFGQLEQIVEGANHRPPASDLVELTHQELPETFGLLDLSEHGFDNLLAQPVAATPASAAAVWTPLRFGRPRGIGARRR